MVMVFDAHAAETPAGKPFAPETPEFEIPVARVVVCVIAVKALLIQTDGAEDALLTVSQAGLRTTAIPAISLGEVFTVQFTLPLPVVPAAALVAHAAPIQAVLLALLPTSNSSVKVAGEVIVQLLPL
jgi:hypothetical protein